VLPFLDMVNASKLPDETLAWAVTKEAVSWRSMPLGTSALLDRVAALRCGLDASSWEDAAGWPQETAIDKQRVEEQQSHRARCKQLLGLEMSSADWPPFDLVKSHELYQTLLAPFADLTKGKHLIIVPSGPLTSLPFHVLVTKAPEPTLTGTDRYRKAGWLVLRQPVTVLPSVGSLHALRPHGLIAGKSEAILNAKAEPEPALILTPPKDGTPASELEEDDGLLTASEVAQLELDADWIVLSARNTAAGDKGDAEALSGLPRSFFYAKARALLVSTGR
jgi:CHAT domain-containing protein